MRPDSIDAAPDIHEQELRQLNLNTQIIGVINDAGISLRAVTKRYGKKAVVDDISLVIEPGEFMTFLGPSGSGKTTTLNMIAGFVSATEGLLHIYGKPVAKLPAHKRDIGMVFQNYALFPHKTVAENIAYPLDRRKISRSEQKTMIAGALQMVRMGEFGDRYPTELSGGQQQRVALARALVYQPRVLLMDEPLGALDKKLREWLQKEIKRIHREVGSTFVYVTHDQEEALSLSDRIAVFNNGRIEQVGSPAELYQRPATLFVGRFLGESTVLSGSRVDSLHGTTTLNISGHDIRVPGEQDSTSLAILIRPENITLHDEGTVTDSTRINSLPVIVLDSSYLGSAWRCEVQLPDGSVGTVREAHSTIVREPGTRAVMRWNVDSGVLLVDTGEAGVSLT
ncbi:ABC transporter ATP-binding protein [Cryobacterium sp. TMT1-3]|uniref:ABC-type quaternary amine transporter n=1 Tax=Cryobacterium luteum TaxID=1424661 RepID=A0A1H8F2I7_9MICO|nr:MULTISPECIES: ABC transporter ATP-binding protein [Cryobacterium]TFB85490.1 ABC transporter ATP-binding protein [Cryobacterium luteum]TFC26606.1 ABC transporter ATP-binding protein [Cryobacterium sp. TMT1-3]SEN25925.1 putative spermidine/putrescine transport system ATP-binding protein [Cryobacterium luteum]